MIRIRTFIITWLVTTATLYHTSSAQSAIQRFDSRTLEYLADHRTEGQTKLWLFLSNTNDYVNVAIPAGLLTAGLINNDTEMKKNALYVASSTATTFLLNSLIKKLTKRPRPFVYNIHFNAVYEPKSSSFPSGHTSSAFSTATALSRAYSKWYVIAPAYLWAGSVGYSRMYLGVHNPSDVAAGAILGAGVPFALDFLRP
ncbi:phosphatase PAP2 family protein [Chitinophaga tropicalis]|uniref:Phosphatase PAP2 family protein n=1 Tax=Chitinophaga tropicalis TaxID=2683588 RepID=A0A7K1U4A3_9BACT|nr:phosphatase PAP2 family protein [Chitinophaga tropicalis]MVT09126.1 phosphatase PAP2 family protein [Chitinophaga tropicalis]